MEVLRKGLSWMVLHAKMAMVSVRRIVRNGGRYCNVTCSPDWYKSHVLDVDAVDVKEADDNMKEANTGVVVTAIGSDWNCNIWEREVKVHG